MSDSIRFIDLFCGIGSFHTSLKRLGWECVFACDINKECRDTYKLNHGFEPVGDIRDVDVKNIPLFDVLCAGFPCQPFSIAGHHKGFEDDRGNMFFQLMRFVEHHQPPAIILENVSNLDKHDNGNTMKVITTKLEEHGYIITKNILTCSDYGIPQMRKRVFIVATKTKLPDKALEFKKQDTLTLTSFLNENRPKDERLFFTKKDVAYTIRCGGRHSPINDGHNWDGYYVKKKKSDTEEFVYRFTIKDCLKLQGFDENTFKLVGSDKEQWKMLGNTIPVNLTALVGDVVDTYLKQRKNKKMKMTKDE